MKYIKKYETITDDIKIEPQVGDYVICEEQTNQGKELNDFINNTIGIFNGKVNQTTENILILYSVKYKDIPHGQKSGSNFTYFVKGNYYTRNFYRREIKHISKDKKELEAILAAKKYNL